MSGEFVAARDNPGTIKASFTWANNKNGSRIYSNRTTAPRELPVDYEVMRKNWFVDHKRRCFFFLEKIQLRRNYSGANR
jgi:hypothetical protein